MATAGAVELVRARAAGGGGGNAVWLVPRSTSAVTKGPILVPSQKNPEHLSHCSRKFACAARWCV